MEVTDGRPSKPDYYTLPLGSSALDDGILVVKTLQRQMEENRDHYRVIPAGSVFKDRWKFRPVLNRSPEFDPE